MYVDCDKIFRVTIPAVKAAVAKELAEKHDMSEKDIAHALSVAQPAISKYLSRYALGRSDFETKIKSNPNYRKIISAVLSNDRRNSVARMIDSIASDRNVVKTAMKIIG